MTITPEQLNFRRGKIGASEMAQAVGRGWGGKTRAHLYHKLKGNIERDPETISQRVGNHMEPLILREYERATGRDAMEFPETQVHPDEPRIICHCDGKTVNAVPERLIEIKNVGPHMKQGWSEGPPEYVRIQACGQSMLTGIKRVDVAAYFGGNDLSVFELEFKASDHAKLYDALKDFLGFVDRNEEPPHVQADLPFLGSYYEDSGDSIEANTEILVTASRLAQLKSKLTADKDYKEVMDSLEFKIKEYMGEHSTLMNRDGDVIWTWKANKDKKVVDWEAVAFELATMMDVLEDRDVHVKLLPTYAARHTTTKKGSRVFKCKI